MSELHRKAYGQKGFANGVAIDSVNRFHCAGVHVAWGSSDSDDTGIHPISNSECSARFADGSATPDSLATESASIATTHKFWKLDRLDSVRAKRAKTRASRAPGGRGHNAEHFCDCTNP